MSAPQYPNTAEAVKAHLGPISDFIESYTPGIAFKPVGNKLVTNCPLGTHSDSTPSFQVTPEIDLFYCFGCGVGGDHISYVIAKDNIPFKEAIQLLADRAGIIDQTNDPEATMRATRYKLLATVHEWFIAQYKALPDDHPCIQEVTKRHMQRDVYPFGYAPEDDMKLINYLTASGFEENLLIDMGFLGKQHKRGLWKNRLIFTFTNAAGKPIAFTGRTLDPNEPAKYKNSSNNKVFQKSQVLFNLTEAKHHIRSQSSLIVAEGQFDIVAFTQAGLPAAIGTSGTSLSDRQIELLQQARGPHPIIFAFDGDTAGQHAFLETLKKHPDLVQHSEYIAIPTNDDPCNYLETHGPQALLNLYNQRVPAVVGAAIAIRATSEEHELVAHSQAFIKQLPTQDLARVFALETVRTNTLDPAIIFEAWEYQQPIATPQLNNLVFGNRITNDQVLEKRLRLAALLLQDIVRAQVTTLGSLAGVLGPELSQIVVELWQQRPMRSATIYNYTATSNPTLAFMALSTMQTLPALHEGMINQHLKTLGHAIALELTFQHNYRQRIVTSSQIALGQTELLP